MSHDYQEPESLSAVPITVNHLPRLPRRTVFKWFVAVTTALKLGDASVFGAEPLSSIPLVSATGYGGDPRLNQAYSPGDVWPLTLSRVQRAAATALADVILPADNLGPAASEVHVIDFVDEWVSAPYAAQRLDREIVLPGLDWLDAEADSRFQRVFAELAPEQQNAICDDICFVQDATDEFRSAARFFSRFRSLAAAAYYATPPGWEAIGYVGNQPSSTYDGPPQEVLTRLGVQQTVS